MEPRQKNQAGLESRAELIATSRNGQGSQNGIWLFGFTAPKFFQEFPHDFALAGPLKLPNAPRKILADLHFPPIAATYPLDHGKEWVGYMRPNVSILDCHTYLQIQRPFT